MIHVPLHIPNRIIRWPVESSPIEYVCPYCDQLASASHVYDRVDGVPIIFPFRTTWICCSACGREARSKVKTVDLALLNFEDRADFICRYQSFVGRTVVVLAMITCLVPFLGLILSAFAFVATFREGNWTEKASRTCLCISCCTTGLIVFVLADPFHWTRTPVGP